MTYQDYNDLKNILMETEWFNWGELIANVGAGLKARAAIQDPSEWDDEDMSFEINQERNLIKTLCLLQTISLKNNSKIELPNLAMTDFK